MALFWLRTSYHAQRYMFQRYMLRSLLTQSFNIVNTPIILLFSKKWVPGLAAEDNTTWQWMPVISAGWCDYSVTNNR